jgi:hypothetical protein
VVGETIIDGQGRPLGARPTGASPSISPTWQIVGDGNKIDMEEGPPEAVPSHPGGRRGDNITKLPRQHTRRGPAK